MIHGLGKDTELRAAQAQQEKIIAALMAQNDANASHQLRKKDAFMIVLGVIAIMLIFK